MTLVKYFFVAVSLVFIGCQAGSKKETVAEVYLKEKAARENALTAEGEASTKLKVQTCLSQIEACDMIFSNIQEHIRCQQKVETACPVPGIDQGTEDKRVAWVEKVSAQESELNPSGLLKKKYCDSGFRWSYSVTTTPKNCPQCYVVASEFKKNMKGEFTEKDKCEEARILADEDSKFKMSNSCFRRYIGELKKIHLWKAKVMILEDSYQINENSMDLFFLSADKCENAIAKGIGFFRDKFSKEIEVGAAGTETKNRFIGKCTKIEQVLCLTNSEDIEKLPPYIL